MKERIRRNGGSKLPLQKTIKGREFRIRRNGGSTK